MVDKPPKPAAPFVIDVNDIEEDNRKAPYSTMMDALELARRLRCHLRVTLYNQRVVISGHEDVRELYKKLTGEAEQ